MSRNIQRSAANNADQTPVETKPYTPKNGSTERKNFIENKMSIDDQKYLKLWDLVPLIVNPAYEIAAITGKLHGKLVETQSFQFTPSSMEIRSPNIVFTLDGKEITFVAVYLVDPTTYPKFYTSSEINRIGDISKFAAARVLMSKNAGGDYTCRNEISGADIEAISDYTVQEHTGFFLTTAIKALIASMSSPSPSPSDLFQPMRCFLVALMTHRNTMRLPHRIKEVKPDYSHMSHMAELFDQFRKAKTNAEAVEVQKNIYRERTSSHGGQYLNSILQLAIYGRLPEKQPLSHCMFTFLVELVTLTTLPKEQRFQDYMVLFPLILPRIVKEILQNHWGGMKAYSGMMTTNDLVAKIEQDAIANENLKNAFRRYFFVICLVKAILNGWESTSSPNIMYSFLQIIHSKCRLIHTPLDFIKAVAPFWNINTYFPPDQAVQFDNATFVAGLCLGGPTQNIPIGVFSVSEIQIHSPVDFVEYYNEVVGRVFERVKKNNRSFTGSSGSSSSLPRDVTNAYNQLIKLQKGKEITLTGIGKYRLWERLLYTEFPLKVKIDSYKHFRYLTKGDFGGKTRQQCFMWTMITQCLKMEWPAEVSMVTTDMFDELCSNIKKLSPDQRLIVNDDNDNDDDDVPIPESIEMVVFEDVPIPACMICLLEHEKGFETIPDRVTCGRVHKDRMCLSCQNRLMDMPGVSKCPLCRDPLKYK